MNAPAHSVLIPAYNAAPFLGRTLDSALGQTFRDLEVVVVDNASTDSTWSLLEAHAARDPRVRAFRNPSNLGPVRNWARCAELARGRTASLLFADDWYEPEFLESLATYLEAPSVGFAYSAVTVSDGEGGGQRLAYRLPRSGQWPVARYLAGHVEELATPVPSSPGCAVFRLEDLRRTLRRSLDVPDRLGAIEHGAGPDVRCFWDACARYAAFAHERRPLANFRRHAGNLSARPEIRAAYQNAWLDFLAEGALPGVSIPGARARAWLALRGDPLQREVVGDLSFADWCRLPGAVVAKGIRRAAGLAGRGEGTR